MIYLPAYFHRSIFAYYPLLIDYALPCTFCFYDFALSFAFDGLYAFQKPLMSLLWKLSLKLLVERILLSFCILDLWDHFQIKTSALPLFLCVYAFELVLLPYGYYMPFDFTNNICEICDDFSSHLDLNVAHSLHLPLYDNASRHNNLFGVSKAHDMNCLIFLDLYETCTSLGDTFASHTCQEHDYDGSKLYAYFDVDSPLHILLHLLMTQCQNCLIRYH